MRQQRVSPSFSMVRDQWTGRQRPRASHNHRMLKSRGSAFGTLLPEPSRHIVSSAARCSRPAACAAGPHFRQCLHREGSALRHCGRRRPPRSGLADDAMQMRRRPQPRTPPSDAVLSHSDVRGSGSARISGTISANEWCFQRSGAGRIRGAAPLLRRLRLQVSSTMPELPDAPDRRPGWRNRGPQPL